MISEPQRLHPIAMLLTFFKSVRDLFFPFIFVVFFGGFIFKIIIIVIGIVILILYEIISWVRYTYRVEEEELRIDYGVFVKKKRYIPIERIQSLDTAVGLIHRIFGLVKLQVETAGGRNQSEAVLSAITKLKAEQLKQALKEIQGKKTVKDELDPQNNQSEAQSFLLPFRELFIMASTSGGVGVVFGATAAFMSQLDNLIPFDVYDIFKNWFERSFQFGVLLIVVSIIFGFIIVWLFSILGTILKYGNFRVQKRKDELMITRGLIEQRQLTIPISKIQAVKISENLIRQPLGYVTVYLEVAKSNTDGQNLGITSIVLLPIIKKKKMAEQLSTFLPEFIVPDQLTTLPSRSLRRYIFRAFFPVLFPLIPLSIFLFPWGLISIVFLPLAVGMGYLRYKDGGVAISDELLVLRYRFFSKITILHFKKRIQALETKQNYFQRRKKVSTLSTYILSSTSKQFDVKDLEHDDSEKIVEWYSRQD